MTARYKQPQLLLLNPQRVFGLLSFKICIGNSHIEILVSVRYDQQI